VSSGRHRQCDEHLAVVLMLALARRRAFGCRLVPVLLRMDAKFPPRRLRKLDVIVLCSLLDVREGQRTIRIGDVNDLIEPCDSIAHVLRIGQRLFSLVRKGINGAGKSLCAVSRPCFS